MTKGKCLRVLLLQLNQLNNHNQLNQLYIRVPSTLHLVTRIFILQDVKCQETKTDLDYQQVNWYLNSFYFDRLQAKDRILLLESQNKKYKIVDNRHRVSDYYFAAGLVITGAFRGPAADIGIGPGLTLYRRLPGTHHRGLRYKKRLAPALGRAP